MDELYGVRIIPQEAVINKNPAIGIIGWNKSGPKGPKLRKYASIMYFGTIFVFSSFP